LIAPGDTGFSGLFATGHTKASGRVHFPVCGQMSFYWNWCFSSCEFVALQKNVVNNFFFRRATILQLVSYMYLIFTCLFTKCILQIKTQPYIFVLFHFEFHCNILEQKICLFACKHIRCLGQCSRIIKCCQH
jgi:hypothetical protein